MPNEANEHIEVEDLHQNAMHRVFLSKLDDSGKQQLVDYDGLEGESPTKVLRANPHGLISNPSKDAEGIVASLGTRDMPVFFGGEHPDKRPKDLPEWAAGFYDGSGLLVYGDGKGNVFIKKAKTLDAEVEGEAKLKAGKWIIDGPVEFKSDVKMEKNLRVDKDINNGGDINTMGVHRDSVGGHV